MKALKSPIHAVLSESVAMFFFLFMCLGCMYFMDFLEFISAFYSAHITDPPSNFKPNKCLVIFGFMCILTC